jgi:hypothetical protein
MTEARPCERAPPAIARCAEPSSDQKTIEVLDELAIEYERRADRLEGQGSFGDPKSWRAKLRSADRRSSPTEVKAGPIVNLLAVETAYMPAVIGPKLAGFVIAAAPGPQPVHGGKPCSDATRTPSMSNSSSYRSFGCHRRSCARGSILRLPGPRKDIIGYR